MWDRSMLPLFAGLVLLAAVLGLGLGAVLADRDGGAAAPAPSPTASATGTGEPEPTGTGTETETDGGTGTITASASPASAAAGQRVDITGSYPEAEPGTRIAVQRQEDGEWSDFAADAGTGADGSFSLWVSLGRPGENVLRIVDPATGTASAPFTVTVT